MVIDWTLKLSSLYFFRCLFPIISWFFWFSELKMIERLRLLLIKLALSSAVLTLLVSLTFWWKTPLSFFPLSKVVRTVQSSGFWPLDLSKGSHLVLNYAIHFHLTDSKSFSKNEKTHTPSIFIWLTQKAFQKTKKGHFDVFLNSPVTHKMFTKISSLVFRKSSENQFVRQRKKVRNFVLSWSKPTLQKI